MFRWNPEPELLSRKKLSFQAFSKYAHPLYTVLRHTLTWNRVLNHCRCTQLVRNDVNILYTFGRSVIDLYCDESSVSSQLARFLRIFVSFVANASCKNSNTLNQKFWILPTLGLFQFKAVLKKSVF